eukprot:103924-Alexandrium_andersonii.AAC.1
MGHSANHTQKASMQPAAPKHKPGGPGDKYESSDSSSDDDGLTGAQAVDRAKQNLEALLKGKKKATKNPWANMAAEDEQAMMDQEQDEEMEEPSQQQHKKKEPKEGTSAWAVQQARSAAAKVAAGKRAVNWKSEAQ